MWINKDQNSEIDPNPDENLVSYTYQSFSQCLAIVLLQIGMLSMLHKYNTDTDVAASSEETTLQTGMDTLENITC